MTGLKALSRRFVPTPLRASLAKLLESAWPMLWNEATMLQAFLCFNPYFKIRLSTPLIRHFDEVFLKNHIPIYQSIDQNPNTFSSLWMQRIS